MPTTIQVRTNAKLKKDVQKILEEIGLDMSSAITVYLKKIVITGSIPFPLSTIHDLNIEKEQSMDEAPVTTP